MQSPGFRGDDGDRPDPLSMADRGAMLGGSGM